MLFIQNLILTIFEIVWANDISFVWSILRGCLENLVKDHGNCCLLFLPMIIILNRLFNRVSEDEFKPNDSVLIHSTDKNKTRSNLLYSKIVCQWNMETKSFIGYRNYELHDDNSRPCIHSRWLIIDPKKLLIEYNIRHIHKTLHYVI